jgi:hypothetical protein
METYARPPSFGGKTMNDEYYHQVNAIIATLRPTASQRTIADHLNKSGFRTPRGLPFDRQRLANYLRNTSI